MRKTKYIYVTFLIFFLSKASAQTSALSVADSLYALGNYAAAINEYAKVGDKKSNLQIARAYNAIGNYDKSIAQYTVVLDKNPKFDLARFELGKLLLKTKNFKPAMEMFNVLVSSEQENPEYYYYLGRTYESVKEADKANKAFKTAVAMDSTHLRSLYALGKYYVGQEIKDSALVYIDQGLRFYGNDVAMINLKALAFFNNGQFQPAFPHFERLLELGEEKPFVYEKLAYCYFRNWEPEKALETYHKLTSFPDKLAVAYAGLGEVYFKEKALDSAQYYIKKSIEERMISFPKEYASLGRIARLKGQTKKSIDYYVKAWEENKENYYNYYQVCVLADQYYKDSKTRLNYYEKLLEMYPDLVPWLKERVRNRITEIKEEIHFGSN
ncbi:tetratricopeptide repeat protein [Flagellimonas halotolerans]|uniref:Tetratricopeptide repeat protein n=1 Tax=Flagellimonas halotolerans TaxID=3112164 RepID=A0ABU6IM50_9FLAO|nr:MULTISPECIES: tetratricopeptide repeat protein [unclassified Allomuricauda]MEC3964317.1 tetratricopeptide repeat protein [Muricauda sp. SYSU M86414]MEC4264187.1 tetratricopeptide repeat protein [Muricauda sp. SYSU M84420]